MMPELVHTRHLAQLGLLKDILDEAGLATNLLEKSEAIPIHVLMAGFQEDKKGRNRFLHFSFLPLDEEDIGAIQLLQIYSTLPFHLKEGQRDKAAAVLLAVNTRLPIGHFGINEQNELHYRYVYSLSVAKSFDSEEILEILSMFVYMCDMFAEPVELVASGEAEVAEVLQTLK
ncbi:YbjN domain-containing protein [Paenibacillus sp. SYP-B3998]|uniref:YbjN domain-containing protein n=1 Tax=Paenibacillus sp. SYP-B3998 TaxID=2678564 RepID=A0A6G3ZXF8_9BACL|nr:YbjN domain-containing protein [Paenibacillus sp. SYP-B3998]NEW06906.1 YbjN domain-containing protein [Paenibacillus sp. SYP-B3998]